MFGYCGQYIRLDLNDSSINILPLEESLLRKYIGGAGIASKFVFEETTSETDPLGPGNVLAAFTGPFTGSRISSSSRHHVMARSPQTGILGEASVGGDWGVQLKQAGFDGIVITGKAASPVYLWIHDGECELRPAAQIWGQDAFVSAEWLKAQTNPKATAAVIGQAGENLVRFASIPHIGKLVRQAGRTGLGAVMGSKNLKALVAYGSQPVPIANDEGLRASFQQAIPQIRQATTDFTKYGTSGGVEKYEYLGNFPIQNWRGSRWEEGASKISGVRMHNTILVGRYSCRGCMIACGRHVKIDEGRYAPLDAEGPEYETVGTMGGECLVDDLEAICAANDLCNRYGMDTITTGAVIAFAMEAYEKGLITKTDTDGLELTWGSADALVEMVHRIARGENIGKLLGKGSKAAAEELGGNAVEFAVHVKGLEPSAHDPRRFWTQALSYATAARGACHNAAWAHPYELGLFIPELGIEKPHKSYEIDGLADVVIKLQNFQTLNDTLIMCRFAQVGRAVRLSNVHEWYNLITGLDVTIDELMQVGERIFNMKRLYNTRLGISRKDDFLPPRFMTHNRKGPGMTNQLPPIGQMLNEYYESRGWDEIGVPTPQKLADLGINEPTGMPAV
jgi:aldehyde:ferredoxin oxidoreductase